MSGREIHAASEGETSTPPLMSWPTGWTVRCAIRKRAPQVSRDEGLPQSASTSTERFHPATGARRCLMQLHQNRRIFRWPAASLAGLL